LENLRELDLSMNMLSKIEEIEKLSTLENLKILRVKETLFIENNEHNYMFQILAKMMKLEQINDFKVNSSMRQQTIDFVKWQISEKKRLEKEEEERLAREEEEDN
jgi:Leucine-rich repeat (LRR) protein